MKRIALALTFALSLFLLCSGAAFASDAGDLAVGSIAERSMQPSKAKASKVYLYVLVKEKTSDSTEVYKYNKKGLLVRRGAANGIGTTARYTYSGTNVKRIDYVTKYDGGAWSGSLTASYDSLGRLKKANYKYERRSPATYTYAYDKKGRVKKVTCAYADTANACTYIYDNQNRCVQATTKGADGKSVLKYAYDAKGNLKKVRGAHTADDYSNMYAANGLLASRALNSNGYDLGTTSYTYKRMTVPKACVEKVRAQQFALLNPEVGLAFPGDM